MMEGRPPSKPTNEPAAFGYQTRLLERTTSRSGGGAGLLRSNSQSSNMSLLSQPSGSAAPAHPRRWAPAHRVTNSLDTIRGKWEDRAREANQDLRSSSPIRVGSPVQLTGSSTSSSASGLSSPTGSMYRPDRRPSSPSSNNEHPDFHRTPTYMKRHTMPAPIIATPLSPNTTGISVEADSPTATSPAPNRIRLPLAFQSSQTNGYGHSRSDVGAPVPTSPPPMRYRSHTLDAALTKESAPATSPAREPFPRPISSFPSPQRRPTSMYGSSVRTPVDDSFSKPTIVEPPPLSANAASSVMAPPQYRSSYMANRSKGSSYGDHLGIGRKLGRHLPRIASGDGEEERDRVVAQQHREEEQRSQAPAPTETRESKRAARLRERMPDTDLPLPSEIAPGADDVTGVPGRLRLSRSGVPSTPSPSPSARLTRGLWADVQRHHMQVYEYLCHVGEAQQWIEGCLDEELGFGVVDMEEELRNGVVLAKLVRVFRPEMAKKIYEAAKLVFRHSDNINYFFNFVRDIGLPESFIFELTDLYDKKNIPKVIYCIHALSHLLARRGMAERIGNLLGALKFSDDQLRQAQKGLNDAGVTMPNFGSVGKELARDLNEEPEVEVESEDERRDRLLLENEDSIQALQSAARGFIVRQQQRTMHARLQLVQRDLVKLQGHCRGVLVRRKLAAERKEQHSIVPLVLSLQATARGRLVRAKWLALRQELERSSRYIVKIQAQLRGVLQRRRFARLKAALRTSSVSATKLQSMARAKLARVTHRQINKSFEQSPVQGSVVSLQARARGVLARREARLRYQQLGRMVPIYVALQAHCRGVLMRRRLRNQLAKLDDVSDIVVRIQAAVRTYLARKRLLVLIRAAAAPAVTKALAQTHTIVAVGGLQALARASIARNRHRELTRTLDFIAPDVRSLQAVCRGVLVRGEFWAWRDHVRRSHPIATLLQAMFRGTMQRQAYRAKIDYYRANLKKVVKIQSLFRAKETREQYRQLTLGTNVSVGTIKNFVHLLDDSENDFQDEVKVERLRKRVVESIRENQTLESELSDLDVKIALVVQNVQSFDTLVRAKRLGADNAAALAARASLLAAYGDPFSGPNTIDQAARRKLELYQQLFYLLQTRPEYLSALFVQLAANSALEKNRRFTERAVLTIFGFGQDRREDFLLLKLFQLSVQEEVRSAATVHDIIHGHPVYINSAVPYVRAKLNNYVRESLQGIVRRIVDPPAAGEPPIDLETDPSAIWRARVELEEIHLGTATNKRKDLNFREAIEDLPTRTAYVQALRTLQDCTQWFITALTQSVKRMPYSIRYLARETLIALKERFPDATDTMYAACIGRLVYYRCINPAIVTPETFDLVSKTIDRDARRNLDQISRVLTQITSGTEFDEDSPIYIPINEFVRTAIREMTAWLLEVANVPDADVHFHAHEFLDATVPPKPIYISPNEIYTMHGLLGQYQDAIAPPSSNDPLRAILSELGGVPNLGSDELKDARDQAITLELTNRFANVRDPHAEEKTLWVQAKRGVLMVLKVHPDENLFEALLREVTPDDEMIWEDILESEAQHEQAGHSRRQPSTTAGDAAYRLDDISSFNFAHVKLRTIEFLIKLEKLGKVSRSDGFQGILNAIAADVRSKHRKRIQRQQEMESMTEALQHLAENKKQLEEKINSYHSYAEAAMQTMQRGGGKKRKQLVLPFTKQYFHLRDLQRSGETPQFGSFLYTAKYLYEKGILLSVDQFSPRQFDKLHITMSSNTPGVFTLLLESVATGITTKIASEDVKMEDLLQAKYEKRPFLSLFNGKAKVNFERFLVQINKKFYT
ncbi:unnamed protein product [Mycena citricolor]|uniref:Uncharacterized protein n=1 Tax=Mycena citricolor TaxID=2018698 RepID=A0AAD2Q593_9AGAR|nr:unnamed protein product [Mycena citricolor]